MIAAIRIKISKAARFIAVALVKRVPLLGNIPRPNRNGCKTKSPEPLDGRG